MRVLGISPAHDASVCVINDGKLEYYFKEERLSRKKRDKHPYLSLIEIHKLLGESIDYCVIASPTENDWDNNIAVFVHKLFGCPIEFMCNKHHLQHAALAFENSDFNESLVFVIDRNGSVVNNLMRESETVFVATKYPYKFKEIHKNYWAFNLGGDKSPKINELIKELSKQNPICNYVCKSSFNVTKVYETATSLISQHPLENGKTMGLSSYGKEDNYPDFFGKDCIPIDYYFSHDIKDFSPDMSLAVHNDLNKKTVKNIEKNNYTDYANYAYQVQKQTQEQVCNFIKKYVRKTGIKNVVITGGYGLNIVSNSFYVKNIPEVNFYFEPLSDDSGNSIGSAIYFYKVVSKDTENYKLKDTFFHGIQHDLSNVMGKLCSYDEVVELLLNQKSLGVYCGLSEAGPRSLGHRSIIFDATNKSAKDLINKIKKREWYRPFAAVCLEEDCQKYFDMLSFKKSEFMTNSFNVKDKYKNILGGITHVDGTCRVQTINESSILFNILKKIKEKNNIGVLLNTSFNLSGEPLVDTPEQAIDCLNNSCLDYVWFPEKNILVE